MTAHHKSFQDCCRNALLKLSLCIYYLKGPTFDIKKGRAYYTYSFAICFFLNLIHLGHFPMSACRPLIFSIFVDCLWLLWSYLFKLFQERNILCIYLNELVLIMNFCGMLFQKCDFWRILKSTKEQVSWDVAKLLIIGRWVSIPLISTSISHKNKQTNKTFVILHN